MPKQPAGLSKQSRPVKHKNGFPKYGQEFVVLGADLLRKSQNSNPDRHYKARSNQSTEISPRKDVLLKRHGVGQKCHIMVQRICVVSASSMGHMLLPTRPLLQQGARYRRAPPFRPCFVEQRSGSTTMGRPATLQPRCSKSTSFVRALVVVAAGSAPVHHRRRARESSTCRPGRICWPVLARCPQS